MSAVQLCMFFDLGSAPRWISRVAVSNSPVTAASARRFTFPVMRSCVWFGLPPKSRNSRILFGSFSPKPGIGPRSPGVFHLTPASDSRSRSPGFVVAKAIRISSGALGSAPRANSVRTDRGSRAGRQSPAP